MDRLPAPVAFSSKSEEPQAPTHAADMAAAALNAERSAQNLKHILLTRKNGTPMNSQAVGQVAFKTAYEPVVKVEPKDVSDAWKGLHFDISLTPTTSVPNWMTQADLSQSSLNESRSRSGSSKHGRSATLKGVSTTSPDIVNFDWGFPITPQR